MLKSPFVLIAAFFVFGNSGALAESSHGSHNESLRLVTFQGSSADEQTGKSQQEKLDILQSKFEELEAQMKQLLPESSLKRPGVNSENVPYASSEVRMMQDWSSMDHLKEAKASQHEADKLETRVQKLESRIDELSQKPYLDTKGFKRSGLKILKGNLTQDLREATQKTAWHRMQAKTIMYSESKDQQRS